MAVVEERSLSRAEIGAVGKVSESHIITTETQVGKDVVVVHAGKGLLHELRVAILEEDVLPVSVSESPVIRRV